MIVGEPQADDPIAIRLAAYGLVRREGALLLCHIAEGYAGAGGWTLPGGGVEFGEAPAAAAVREIHEETGLEVELSGAPRILTDSGITTLWGPPQRYHQVRFVYPVRVVGGEERVEVGNSTDGFAWFSDADLEAAPLVDLVRLALEQPPSE
jgi:ADP-ribose pyrophosphatase YjhB (NUDIX family)